MRKPRGVAPFPDLCVYQKTEPESLKDPEDQSLRSVQKAKPEEIAVDEQTKGPDEKGHAIILLPQEPLSLCRISSHIRRNSRGALSFVQFGYFAVGPSVVSCRPFA